MLLREMNKKYRHSEEERRRDELLTELQKQTGKISVHYVASELAKIFETQIGRLYVEEGLIVRNIIKPGQFISDSMSIVDGENTLEFLEKYLTYEGMYPLICMKVGGSCPREDFIHYRGKIVVRRLFGNDATCSKVWKGIIPCDDLGRGFILYV